MYIELEIQSTCKDMKIIAENQVWVILYNKREKNLFHVIIFHHSNLLEFPTSCLIKLFL